MQVYSRTTGEAFQIIECSDNQGLDNWGSTLQMLIYGLCLYDTISWPGKAIVFLYT